MNTGGMRLHWDDRHGSHLYQDHPCLNDALNHAATVQAQGGTITRLSNWMDEDACPLDQVRAVAKMRADDYQVTRRSDREREAMEANPIYGTF